MKSRTGSMNVLMFAFGSGGDVYPNVTLAKGLLERGHQVSFVTAPFFQEAVEQAGLNFIPNGTEDEGRAAIEDPELWQQGRGFRVLFRKVLEYVPRTYRLIEEHHNRSNTVVVATSLAWGARIAQEKLGVPLASVHLQPLLFRSLHEQPGADLPPLLRPLLPSLRRVLTGALDRWVLDPVIVPGLNAFRSELGLPPVSRVLKDWIHSPQLVIGLFPEWFAKRQPDWPANVHLTGFPVSPHAAGAELPPELDRFLAAGAPPIAFTLGTAMLFGEQFFRESTELCRKLNRRGLLLTRFPAQLPPNLPDTVLHVPFADFRTLLPRVAGLVHHGGIGTTSEALAAGIPQLITPLNFDQPDNAVRMRRLGVGEKMRPGEYRVSRAASKLEHLLTSAEVRASCQRVAARFAGTNWVEDTCRLIESLAPGAGEKAATSG